MMGKSKKEIIDVSCLNKQMTDNVHLLAKGLIGAGVKKDSHVALLAPACRDLDLLYLAIVRIGAIPVCLQKSMLQSNLTGVLKETGCKAIITSNIILGSVYDSTIFDGLDVVIFLEETVSEDKRVKDVTTIRALAEAV